MVLERVPVPGSVLGTIYGTRVHVYHGTMVWQYQKYLKYLVHCVYVCIPMVPMVLPYHMVQHYHITKVHVYHCEKNDQMAAAKW